MADLREAPPRQSPQLGWCLALYPRLSRRARRRLAALLVAAALVAQPPPGYVRGEGATGRAGSGFGAPIAQHAPVPLQRASAAGSPGTNPAVERALHELGLDAPAAPAAMDATPAGSEFQVNSYTTRGQRFPSVAMDADGDFVVVWQSDGSGGTDTSFYSIQGQRYNAAGSPVGSQFQVNTSTGLNQGTPSVAMDADGDFVVVWESGSSGGADTGGYSIQGQRYNAAGSPVGSEFQVNSYTTGDQRSPSVAMDADGDFVVVWESDGSGGADTGGYSIQGQRYNAAGSPVGSEFQVNSYTTSDQRWASVAMDADGDFVVVWYSDGSGGADTDGYSIQGQRYNAAGGPVGSEFQVNSYTTSDQRFPSVAMDADGDFVVVWYSLGSDGTDTDGYSIQARRYNSAGIAAGGEFQVNTYTTGAQFLPSVALDADGDFVVVWHSFSSDGIDSDDASIQGQSYTAAGTAVGGQFQVNTYSTANQRVPSVAMDSDGDFVVAWLSFGSGGTDTSNYSIQAQRYNSSNAPTPSPTPTSAPAGTATPQPPTAVDLRYFQAIGLADRAILVWETASEVDPLGFQVLRAADAGGPWTPVNAALIPAEGGAAAGRSYVLRDAPGRGTWHYRLEDVGADGKRTPHAAVQVRVGPGAGRELFLPSLGAAR